MAEKSVQSTCVSSANWEDGELTINFTDETSYLYFDVPSIVWANVNRNISIGSYFNRFIRGKYAYERL